MTYHQAASGLGSYFPGRVGPRIKYPDFPRSPLGAFYDTTGMAKHGYLDVSQPLYGLGAFGDEPVYLPPGPGQPGAPVYLPPGFHFATANDDGSPDNAKSVNLEVASPPNGFKQDLLLDETMRSLGICNAPAHINPGADPTGMATAQQISAMAARGLFVFVKYNPGTCPAAGAVSARFWFVPPTALPAMRDIGALLVNMPYGEPSSPLVWKKYESHLAAPATTDGKGNTVVPTTGGGGVVVPDKAGVSLKDLVQGAFVVGAAILVYKWAFDGPTSFHGRGSSGMVRRDAPVIDGVWEDVPGRGRGRLCRPPPTPSGSRSSAPSPMRWAASWPSASRRRARLWPTTSSPGQGSSPPTPSPRWRAPSTWSRSASAVA